MTTTRCYRNAKVVVRGGVLAGHGLRGGGSDLFEALSSFSANVSLSRGRLRLAIDYLPLLLCQIFQLSFRLHLRQHAGFVALPLPRDWRKLRRTACGYHTSTGRMTMEMKVRVQMTISSQILGCDLFLR